MDQDKVKAVTSWPQPTTIKELRRFLGFSNFYRRFIAGYSAIVNPLTDLLRGQARTFQWTAQAEQAFLKLKHVFTHAPLLSHPDPDSPFVMEVDASSAGVGAILSQYQGTPRVLHPCAYFSRKLSSAERNYDIGNRELLAIKLALEEWRHWLEGAAHPFLVLTDHKNLQYLREAKRLNPRQAWWALFFTRINFQIQYRSKNIKADTLSRLYDEDCDTELPENILPSDVFAAPIQWTSPTLPDPADQRTPPGCPPGLQYVPRLQRKSLIHSAHSSVGTGHPGVTATLGLLKGSYWWPNMGADVRRYIRGCVDCAVSKSSRHLPVGKLCPLPTPNRPWSHIGVDFITDLPNSNGNTCILVIVDRFSKFCRLLPLVALPTALQTAELLFDQVFRIFGLPEDIVSDRGPQFISRVWKSFFSLLQTSVSLSSGYHPQTNGQTERKIQEVSRFLRTFCRDHQDRWERFLGWAEYAQNSLIHSSTGLTPFQCILGYQPPLFPWSGRVTDVPAVDFWFRESERVWEAAHLQLQRARGRQQRTADARRRDS
uniref:Gypsy retrotransposon integrase-like protein 1 n=1 Tax=Mastacembelus armatus TaxID=205130 RepID=A0A3Q3LFZ5_9TELE